MVILPVSCNLKEEMKYFVPPQIVAPMASGMIGALSNGMDWWIICCSYFRFFLVLPPFNRYKLSRNHCDGNSTVIAWIFANVNGSNEFWICFKVLYAWKLGWVHIYGPHWQYCPSTMCFQELWWARKTIFLHTSPKKVGTLFWWQNIIESIVLVNHKLT